MIDVLIVRMFSSLSLISLFPSAHKLFKKPLKNRSKDGTNASLPKDGIYKKNKLFYNFLKMLSEVNRYAFTKTIIKFQLKEVALWNLVRKLLLCCYIIQNSYLPNWLSNFFIRQPVLLFFWTTVVIAHNLRFLLYNGMLISIYFLTFISIIHYKICAYNYNV